LREHDGARRAQWAKKIEMKLGMALPVIDAAVGAIQWRSAI
jgi:hypothetical protein